MWVCISSAYVIAEEKQSLHFSICPEHFSHDDMRVVCRVLQMPDMFACPPLLSLPLPLVPAWAQGLNQSIRASRLQEPEHSSLSVLPREVQPCLGRCICGLGASWGKRANPGTPACWFHSRPSLSAQPDP